MESKTLFYVIAFIGWMIFKFFESQKGLLKKAAQQMEPSIATTVPPEPTPVIKKPVRLPIVKKPLRHEKNKIVAPIVEKKQTENAAQIKSGKAILEIAKTPTIIDDIRGGNVDWRKAILLSEILRPV